MADSNSKQTWKYIRGLAPPVLVLVVLVGWLAWSLYSRTLWWQETDEYNLREWLNESRVFRKTLPDLAREYLRLHAAAHRRDEQGQPILPTSEHAYVLQAKAEEIQEQLQALGNPTKIYQGQLPLFPEIYRLELRFRPPLGPSPEPLAWDSHLPRPGGQDRGRVRRLEYRLLGERDDRAVLHVEYQLHAYNKRQQDEEEQRAFWIGTLLLAGAAVLLAGAWVWFFLRRERERELQHLRAQQQIEHAEKLLLENELRQEEARRKHEELERTLLEQRLATQQSESRLLEMKSQLFASIGIMAGSYAHNIKNLLVRPNDLLRRCLESDGLSTDQGRMIDEVRQTLGTVTERLQQILRTVRRDPSRSEMARLDLNAVVVDIQRTWKDLALEKWKLQLRAELHPNPLWIEGDLSHLQQGVENLVFNARDATFERRNQLRDAARTTAGLDPAARRQALIDAAAWKGTVTLRTLRHGDQALLEVEDNGIGMTEEVRRRCREPHFSTKRDNALYQGDAAGMGLGLSFVVVILEHHRAMLEIESEPSRGTLFRIRIPSSP